MERVLITYASRFGSTAEVAKRLSDVLNGCGIMTDVAPIESTTSLHGYDAVIVGSLIRGGKWVPEAMEFLARHRAELRAMPVAYFTICMTLQNDTVENRETVLHYHDALLYDFPDIRPLSIGMFAGACDYARMPIRVRIAGKLQGIANGDFRNWHRIENWGREISFVLKAQGAYAR